MDQADGILYTENKILKNGTIDTVYPVYLVAKNIGATHSYIVAFKNVRHNFAIAGLISCVEVIRSSNFQLMRSNLNRIYGNKLELFFPESTAI